MILAASEYREFISLFPYSPSAPHAQYQIAMTYYKKVLKPKILDCEERLAAQALHIGEYYHKVRVFKASVSRLTEILTNYPNFSRMDKVYYYLGNSYYKWKKFEQSIPYFTKLISDFPQSKFAEKATGKLEEIEKKKQEI